MSLEQLNTYLRFELRANETVVECATRIMSRAK